MKRFIIIGTILAFCSSFMIKAKYSSPLKVNISIQSRENIKLAIKITLTNTTSDTVIYQSMSCSWWSYFTTNSDDIRLGPRWCDKNVPIKVSIPPYSKEEKLLECVLTTKMPVSKTISFKVGFNFTPAEKTEAILFSEWSAPEKINYIWSNSLKIN